ncbi:MAG TPA: zeta toxin family protein [Longimicrobium sp.]|jgi:predicted ABC-type ATPase
MADSVEPHAVIVAGPNGAGKSTLAPRLLVGRFQVPTYVNADVIAQGLAGFNPASAAIQAGRIMLSRLDDLRRARANFALETTLSGISLRNSLTRLLEDGYAVHLLYLWLSNPETSLERVRTRVRLGGHSVPEADIRRRFLRSAYNFDRVYRRITTDWVVYNASAALTAERPDPVALGAGGTILQISDQSSWDALQRQVMAYERGE